jgi:tRNA-binding protein
MQITWDDFTQIEMRVGTIRSAVALKGARKPAYALEIDFGEYGMKRSSAQITDMYKPDDLAGRQVVAVLNFPVKQFGNFFSECLVLGVYEMDNTVVLLTPLQQVENGCRIG